MYSRQQPPSGVASPPAVTGDTEQVEGVVVCDQGEVKEEEPSVLAEFSETDLKQLTDCLDLIDAEFLPKTGGDDLGPLCLGADADEIGFSTDSVISDDLSRFGCVDSSAAIIRGAGDSTVAKRQSTHELVNSYTMSVDLGGAVTHGSTEVKAFEASDSWVESLLCGYAASSSSPSSSSGCESDFSFWSDEAKPYSDDNGLLDSYDDQFNDLFPELF